MAHTWVDAADVEPIWGTFRLIRHAVGGTAFGINQIDFPPGHQGPEHDELESNQEELYYCISGSGVLAIDGDDVEMRPGRYILVSPDAKRRPRAGDDGMSFICIGGVPGGVYEPWDLPEEESAETTEPTTGPADDHAGGGEPGEER